MRKREWVPRSVRPAFALPLAAAVALSVCLIGVGVGCKKEKTSATSPVTTANSDPEIQKLKQQLYDQQVASERLAAAYRDLQAKRAAEVKSAQGVSEATDTAAAKATVDLRNAMAAMGDTIDKLSAKLDALAAAQNQPRVALGGGLSAADWQKLVEEFAKGHGNHGGGPGTGAGGTTKPTDSPGTTSAPSPADSPSNEADQAIEQFGKIAGAVLCIVQPELCPFVGMFLQGLNLFSSTEERTTFLEGVTNLATNQPLTDEQRRVVAKVVTGPNALNLPPEALVVLNGVTSGDPEIQRQIEAVVTKIISDNPQANSIVGQLTDGMDAKAAADQTRQLLGGRFPSKPLKSAVLLLAKRKGLSAEVIHALAGIPE